MIAPEKISKKDAFIKYKFNECRPPRKGDYYLKPSGERGIWLLCKADNDFKSKNYLIVDYVKNKKDQAEARKIWDRWC